MNTSIRPSGLSNLLSKVVCLLLIFICWSCTQSSETEKYQKKRDNIVNVKDKIKEIAIDDILIGRMAQTRLIDNYLIIGDYRSPDKLIHIFDKNDFHYITSTTYQGQGPGEIANMGHIAIDEAHRKFYVSDHGKQKIFSYDLDSVLNNPYYEPAVKADMNIGLFPSEYRYFNDTLCIGRIIQPIGSNNFKPIVGKWNMQTGEIKLMKYEHPDIKKKRMTSDVSFEHGIYAECYSNYDLMTICDLDGNLKYNIYGPKWENELGPTLHYTMQPAFCGNKIIAGYSGEDGRGEGSYPTKFIVFDLAGNYLQTLETGYKIADFCYDKENNRIIMCMNDDIQFGYLDLDLD
ncbi:MAG: 6-bladed beta-propeller [Parabacteroides gordonii]|uniref:6-bladed beta-propeller n=1 Tax=Parabacteroides gordonii TaxID=574930 RepID=UPI003A8C2376